MVGEINGVVRMDSKNVCSWGHMGEQTFSSIFQKNVSLIRVNVRACIYGTKAKPKLAFP
jgi:hypothetical protein